MTDLERFRAYARTMATAQHTPDCRGHAPTRWGWAREVHPDPKCPGCVTDDDRGAVGHASPTRRPRTSTKDRRSGRTSE